MNTTTTTDKRFCLLAFSAIFWLSACGESPEIPASPSLLGEAAAPSLPAFSLPPISPPAPLSPAPDASDCQKGDAPRCFRFALSLEEGLTAPADYQASSKLFRQLCDLGHSDSCTSLAEHLSAGRGLPRDLSAAHALYQSACDAELPRACRQLAEQLEQGHHGTIDLERAQRLYERACSLKDGGACYALGVLFDRVGATHDTDRAASYFDRACLYEEPFSCRWLSRRAHEGRGVPSNEERAQLYAARAVELWEISCARGEAVGCLSLAGAHQTGLGAPPDETRAAADYGRAANLLRWSCEQGDAFGCRDLSDLVDRRGPFGLRDRKAAKKYWEITASSLSKLCEQKDLRACHELAPIFWDGLGVPEDRVQSLVLWKRACDAGRADSCRELSQHQKDRFAPTSWPGSLPSSAPATAPAKP